MARVIAVHEIHKMVEPGKPKTPTSKAIPPKHEIIKPGTVFNVTGDWEAELRAAKAIRDPGKNESVPVDVSKIALPADEDDLADKIAEQEAAVAKANKGKGRGKAKPAEEKADDGDNLV